MPSTDTTNRPAEGWADREDGSKTFTSHEPFSRPPAAPAGYKNRWIARHGSWVTWTYKPLDREDFDRLHAEYQKVVEQIATDLFDDHVPEDPDGGSYDERHNWIKAYGFGAADKRVHDVITDCEVGDVLMVREGEGSPYRTSTLEMKRRAVNPWSYSRPAMYVLVGKTAKTITVKSIPGIGYAEHNKCEPGDLNWPLVEADGYTERFADSGNRIIVPLGRSIDELTATIKAHPRYKRLMQLRERRQEWSDLVDAQEAVRQAAKDKQMEPFKAAAQTINTAMGFGFMRSTEYPTPRIEVNTYGRGSHLMGTDTIGEIIAGRVALERISEEQANAAQTLLVLFKVKDGWADHVKVLP